MIVTSTTSVMRQRFMTSVAGQRTPYGAAVQATRVTRGSADLHPARTG